MKIIGRLIKKSTELGYKRINRKEVSYQNQLSVLAGLILKAQDTEFGFYHAYRTLLKKKDLVSQFQTQVPIVDYDVFFSKWLNKSLDGARDCTWKGKIKYYALSSGTTGSPSKRIPVSIEMIRSFQRSSLRQFSILHTLDLDENFFNAASLAVGGSSQLKKINNRYEGDLSGILKKHTSIIIKPLTKPGKKISSIADWNEKINAMVDKAPSWDIGILAGIPSWCIMLLERIVEKHQLKSIHDIWPNFRVFVHGGVYMAPYLDRLKKVSNQDVILLDTYLASEGYFAYQMSPGHPGMKLLLNNGVFFEFIPFDSHFFSEDGELKNNYKALTISEIKENVDYALVITTNSGLWRYLIGDLVQFIDVKNSIIKISGRIKQFLSLCGEHLSLDNINQAFSELNSKMGIAHSEFTIYADKEALCHHWYIEANNDSKDIIGLIDDALGRLNDDYKSARKHTLHAPKLTLLKPGTVYQYMKSLEKLGGQHKMPRVLNDEQSKQWHAFLNANA